MICVPLQAAAWASGAEGLAVQLGPDRVGGQQHPAQESPALLRSARSGGLVACAVDAGCGEI